MDSVHESYLKKYLDGTFALVRSLAIAYRPLAMKMNQYVTDLKGVEAVDVSNPASWKYFLNISGQYHPTDTLMRVVSIDTLEEIDFTREMLQIHTATRRAYQYGTRYYNALVLKYPNQEFLINGILFPTDINKAINAPDGTIVTYDKTLVEANELTLIEDLEKYIKLQIFRWDVRQFTISDELYMGSFYTILFTTLVKKLMDLRYFRVHTFEAHSFHVRMFLASHQAMDRFLPYLTLKQSLWLYRNIRYIERNFGKLEQFYKLIENILTPRGIPIGDYSVRLLDEFDEVFQPKTIARVTPINSRTNEGFIDFHSLETLYDKESDIAPGNADYLETGLTKELEMFANSTSAVNKTKVLRSSMIDYSNATPVTFEEIAIRQWCYMANHSLYDVVISFKDPKTSINYSLFAKDAFIYFYYVTMKSRGLEIMNVPDYINFQYRIHPKPTVDDLMSVVPKEKAYLRPIAEEIIRRQPDITSVSSSAGFFDLVYRLHQETVWHWFLTSSQVDRYDFGLVENMINRLYADVRMEFDIETPHMGTWLTLKSLPEYNYSYDQAQALLKAIYESATGMIIDDYRLLRNIQKNLIDLMRELSSYSIQFVREINVSDVIIHPVDELRGDNVAAKAIHSASVSIDLETIDVLEKGTDIIPCPLDNLVPDIVCKNKSQVEQQIEVDVGITANGKTEFFAVHDIGLISGDATAVGPLYANDEYHGGYAGVSMYYMLNLEQRTNLPYFP